MDFVFSYLGYNFYRFYDGSWKAMPIGVLNANELSKLCGPENLSELTAWVENGGKE